MAKFSERSFLKMNQGLYTSQLCIFSCNPDHFSINIKRLYRIVFAVGVALAALAGMIAAPMSSVYPNMGSRVLIICFVVVVIGGIGSITGALIASLLVGFVDTFGKVFFQELSGMSIYLLMAVILVWRPEGLMGKR